MTGLNRLALPFLLCRLKKRLFGPQSNAKTDCLWLMINAVLGGPNNDEPNSQSGIILFAGSHKDKHWDLRVKDKFTRKSEDDNIWLMQFWSVIVFWPLGSLSDKYILCCLPADWCGQKRLHSANVADGILNSKQLVGIYMHDVGMHICWFALHFTTKTWKKGKT